MKPHRIRLKAWMCWHKGCSKYFVFSEKQAEIERLSHPSTTFRVVPVLVTEIRER